METIWIIGGGQFGRLAAKRLKKKYKILMVDLDGNCLDEARELGIATKHQDGIQFLADHLQTDTNVTFIVPCLPVHLAWEWCQIKLGPDKLIQKPIPSQIESLLPNPMRGNESQRYVSHADFLCPNNCSEPDNICTKTKQPRKQNMDELLASIQYKDFRSLVIRSRQLGPGIGGYTPGDLFSLLNQIKKQKGRLLISTACRCHGVITGAQCF